MLQEFRCSKCNKLLGKIDGKAEIVCTRCKVLNEFNLPGKETLRYPAWYSEKFKEMRGHFEAFCKANNISAASIIAMAHSELEGLSQPMQLGLSEWTTDTIPKEFADLARRYYDSGLPAKDAVNAARCSECRELRYVGETTRCRSYGNTIIPNADEKHCKDSVR